MAAFPSDRLTPAANYFLSFVLWRGEASTLSTPLLEICLKVLFYCNFLKIKPVIVLSEAQSVAACRLSAQDPDAPCGASGHGSRLPPAGCWKAAAVFQGTSRSDL